MTGDLLIGQSPISGATLTDVTSQGFTVTWFGEPHLEPVIEIYEDSGSTSNLSEFLEFDYFPVHSGFSGSHDNLDRFLSKEDLREIMMQSGIYRVRVTKCLANTDYHFAVHLSSIDSSVEFPESELLTVHTMATELFVDEAVTLEVFVETPTSQSNPMGWLLVLTTPEAQYPVSGIVGDGSIINGSFVSVANLYDTNLSNWDPSGLRSFDLKVYSAAGETEISHQFNHDFSGGLFTSSSVQMSVTDNVDQDGDGVFSDLDPDDNNASLCGDSDLDGCDDCSNGSYDPFNDGEDSDGDGICNTLDSDSSNPFLCLDTDSDGCNDCSTGIFNPSNDGDDFDGDGICDVNDPDDDNDGVADDQDLDRFDAFSCIDSDFDGCDDCSLVGFASPLNDGEDSDADGLCNTLDEDDDGDAVPDSEDDDPLNRFVCADLDFDGCDDCSSGSFDPQNDGFDTDGDGICNIGDSDDDDDGIPDDCDSSGTNMDCNSNGILDSCESDFDSDGFIDDCDSDIDGDNVANNQDSNPTNNFICSDIDADGCDDCFSGTFNPNEDGFDPDGDGICNTADGGDTTPPIAVCQTTVVNLGVNGIATVLAIELDGGSSDDSTPSSLLTFSISESEFTCADVGLNSVTLTVIDHSGNSSECLATVQVIDSIEPHFVEENLADLVLYPQPNLCSVPFANVDLPLVTALDNCGGPVIIQHDAPNTIVADTLVSFLATDSNGNSTQVPLTLNLIVVDNQGPQIATEAINLTVDAVGCSISSSLISFPNVVAIDNCDGTIAAVLQPMQAVFDIGTNFFEYIATDSSGLRDNLVGTLLVVEHVDPVVNISSLVEIVGDGTGLLQVVDYQFPSEPFADNCTPLTSLVSTVTNSLPPNCIASNSGISGFFPYGDSAIDWSVIDESGNEIQFQQILRILLPPELDCDLDGVPDPYEIEQGLETDCDADGLLDSCSLAWGCNLDSNNNGVPDQCECRLELQSNYDPITGYFSITWNGGEYLSDLVIIKEVLDGTGTSVSSFAFTGSVFVDENLSCYESTRYTVVRECNPLFPSSEQRVSLFDLVSFDDSDEMSVAIDGEHVLMSRFDESVVYLFGLNSDLGEYTLLQVFSSPSATVGDGFGFSLEIQQSNRIVIGAPFGELNSGGVYVFNYDSSTNSYDSTPSYLPNPSATSTTGDQFGASVSVGGSTIAIGAPFDDQQAEDAGAIYVFEFDGSEFSLQSKLVSFDGEPGDKIGFSGVEIDDGFLLAGSPDHMSQTGAAYLFSSTDSWLSWELETLSNPNIEIGDLFGSAVALGSKNGAPIAVIGACGYGPNVEGATYSFNSQPDGTWLSSQLPQPLASQFGVSLEAGCSLSLSGEALIVGTKAEMALSYRFVCGGWYQPALLFPEVSSSTFGQKVALTDGVALVADSATDQLYIFEPNPLLFNESISSITYHRDEIHPEAGQFEFQLNTIGAQGTDYVVYQGGSPTQIDVVTSISQYDSSCGFANTHGFSVAVNHPVGISGLSVTDVQVLSIVSGNTQPDYVAVFLDNELVLTPDTGWGVGVLYSFEAQQGSGDQIPFDTVQFSEFGTDVVQATYEASCDQFPTAGGSVELTFQELMPTVVSEPLSNLVLVGSLGNLPINTLDFDPDLIINVSVDDSTPLFVRGDCSANGTLNIQDAVLQLNYLFSGTSISCQDACDVNDDGSLDLVDPMFELLFIMGIGGTPPLPFEECGIDPTNDQLNCNSFPGCQSGC